MNRLLATSLLLFLLVPAPRAAAGVPYPGYSTVPACMALCPMGDMPFTVVVRDVAFNPVPGSTVVLDFSQCPGAYICAAVPTDPYITDPPTRTLRATTDASGSVTFPARVGGVGALGSVRVFADGVLLASRALASPDQNGDGVVLSIIAPDDPIFFPKLGTSDPTADFNCDGTVDLADQTIFGFHHSHSCVGFVDPVRRSTWGTLKAHYR